MAVASETNFENPAAARPTAKARVRDVRLDFFRGLGMFIILIAHTPWNPWNGWIPARFGYSDATEIFVFCSGAASALAFLAVFQKKGWWLGTARIAWRIWQIYWCHIGVFFATLAALIFVDQLVDNGGYYVSVLNLTRFVNAPADFLPTLFSLAYVPNYFDILAMYIVILALVPIMAGLAQINVRYALGFSVLLWLGANQPWLVFNGAALVGGAEITPWSIFNLPAEPVGRERTWFFNPFTWQLVFFTGFAFAAGWLPAPPISRRLMLLAALVLIICVPLDPDGAFRRLLWQNRETELIDAFAWMGFFDPAWRDLSALTSKTFFGLFRYLHFLALAYLVWALAGEAGSRLPSTGIGGAIVLVVRRVGQQSLAVFIASLLIARLMGVWINELGRGDPWVVASANLGGFALIIGVAYFARYFRKQPWKG